MQWTGLAALFCVLVVATSAAWNRRFEVVEGSPLVRVDDGSGEGFRLEKQLGAGAIARTLRLPVGEQSTILRVRFAYRALDLVSGVEKWEDGRLILDWHEAGGRVVGHDTLMTMRGRDEKSRRVELIVRSGKNGWMPVLRVEHLGLSGRMEIDSLRIEAVRERGWVGWVMAGLVGAWGLWCYRFVRSLTRAGPWRVAAAAAILLGMGWFLAVPGPWAHERPLLGEFRIGSEPDSMAHVVTHPAGGMVQDVEPLGKMPVQGSWLLSVKIALSFLRPVLHVMLFAGPALWIAALCGTRCAWYCGVLASCAVEAGQVGFGYGMNALDVVDLLVDWAGIGLAIWIYGKAVSRLVRSQGSAWASWLWK
jgi:hypothetical protein